MRGLATASCPKTLFAWQKPFPLRPLPRELAGSAHGLSLFARPLLRRFLVVVAPLHLAESTFPLHLFLQRFQRLIDVVVTHKNLNQDRSPLKKKKPARSAASPRQEPSVSIATGR
jgi:hypothetical protein